MGDVKLVHDYYTLALRATLTFSYNYRALVAVLISARKIGRPTDAGLAVDDGGKEVIKFIFSGNPVKTDTYYKLKSLLSLLLSPPLWPLTLSFLNNNYLIFCRARYIIPAEHPEEGRKWGDAGLKTVRVFAGEIW